MVFNVVWMVVIPVVVGATVRMKAETMPRIWPRVAGTIASVAIILIIAVVVAANRDRLLGLGFGLSMAMLALNMLAYGAAFGIATALKWHPKQRRTFVIEIGMQNAGLGSVLALQHLNAKGAVPSAFYTALCVLTAASYLPARLLFRVIRAPKNDNHL